MEENEYKKIELPKNDRIEIILVTKKNGKRTKYENPQQACQIFKDILEFEGEVLRDREHFWVMGIDEAGFIVCIYIAALGSNNSAEATALELLDVALDLKSRRIILAHNHPSGTLEPSEVDIKTTNMLYHVCYPIGLEILDHIIIVGNQGRSFSEAGIMKKIHKDEKYKSYFEGRDDRAIAMAKKMLADGEDMDKIIKYTELTKEDIENIIDDLDSQTL